MLPGDIGGRVRLSAEIDQDFGVPFLRTQPSRNPLESLDIVRISCPAIGFVARVRFRRVSSDFGCRVLPQSKPLPNRGDFNLSLIT